MGMHQYVFALKGPLPANVPVYGNGFVRLCEWGKHDNLHNWMEHRSCYKGLGNELNHKAFELDRDDLLSLEQDILTHRMPQTYTYGSTGDQGYDLNFVALGLIALDAGRTIFYIADY